MLSLTDIPDFRHFLSSLLVKASKNEMAELNQLFETTETPWFEKLPSTTAITKASFWFQHLVHYSIVSAKIWENFDYWASVDITLHNDLRSDVFIDVGFLIVSTNYGTMLLFFDKAGSIHKLEFNFREEKRMPPFLFDFLNHFPNKNPRVDQKIKKQIRKIGSLQIDKYLCSFRRKRLKTIEVE